MNKANASKKCCRVYFFFIICWHINPEEQGDYPSSYFTLAKYTYDPNSQLDTMRTNDNSNVIRHFYNNRNWLTQSFRQSSVLMFNYNLTYNANGNIRQSQYSGNYSSNFTAAGGYQYTYIYDNSNRLLKADNDSSNNTTRFDIINGYDKDGNFQGMKRYGSSNNLADDFGYSYFSGTNKLPRRDAFGANNKPGIDCI